jgi:hypothetical protein
MIGSETLCGRSKELLSVTIRSQFGSAALPTDQVFREDACRDMKIYFGFTVSGDRSSLGVARKIVELLGTMEHQVLTHHLVQEDAWEVDRRITPQEVFRRDMKWLEECDLFMAEVSGSSFGLGFETGYLLGATTKKVVLFYRRDLEGKLSLLITGLGHANCRVVPYSGFEKSRLGSRSICSTWNPVRSSINREARCVPRGPNPVGHQPYLYMRMINEWLHT